MQTLTPESGGSSKDILADNIAKLKELFPEAFAEGKIDFDALKQILGQYVDNADERYSFTWNGKSKARRIAQTPTMATLRPCPEESVNWGTTGNIFIEGDNLEVLKLLQKSYYKKIKMIYIDPPYNTGNDFIYPDNFRDSIKNYMELAGQTDGQGRKLSTNSETSGRYHTDWLNMMYPRLRLARNLLRGDGVIFISIDDNEVANLRKICDEVFGEENFICSLVWNKQHSQQQGLFKKYHEHIILYAKEKTAHENIGGGEGIIDAGALKKVSQGNPLSEFTFPAGVRFDAPDGTRINGTFGDTERVTVINGALHSRGGKTAEEVTLAAGWTQKEQMAKYFSGETVLDTKGQRILEFYFNSSGKLKCLKERRKITPPTILPQYGMVSEQTARLASLFDGRPIFESPKPVRMLGDFIRWFADDGDIIVDFFSGSCTTAHAALGLNKQDGGNRRFIMVQLPEPCDKDSEAFKAGYKNIAEIGKERIRRVIKKLNEEDAQAAAKQTQNPALFSSAAGGAAILADATGGTPIPRAPDRGFKVFKLDSSNIKTWDTAFNPLEHTLLNATEKMKPDRTEADVIYEVLLKYGLDLTLPIEKREISGKTVYIIGGGSLLVCLGTDITLPVVEQIAAIKDEFNAHTPAGDRVVFRVVFKDNGFANDMAKTNAVQILQRRGIEDVRAL